MSILEEDDPSMPALTLRALVIGLLLAAFSSSINQLYVFKPISMSIYPAFLVLLAWFFGLTWARFMPQKPNWLNPGPWNVKEHVIATVTATSANASAYATWILSAQQLYYVQQPSVAGGLFLVLATQLVGYGIAGLYRNFLVYPAAMIWPNKLPIVSLLKTSWNESPEQGYKQLRWFFIVFCAVFVYEFIPQYMFPLLGGFSIFCIAKQDSVLFQRLFGGTSVNEGLGLFSFSFDWQYLYNAGALYTPFWAQVNWYVGMGLSMILIPVMYYANVWNAQAYPFLSLSLYTVNQTDGSTIHYPQASVLNPDNSLNETLYAEVGPPQFATSFAASYIFLNIGVSASITHVALFYGKDIWRQFRGARKQNLAEDIHMKLMAAYKEVPAWWYYIVFVGGIALNIGLAYANQSLLPWWGVLFAILMSTFLTLPLGVITAISGNGFGLNVVAEMLCGFVLPGKPIANMYFKTLGFNTMWQATEMLSDLKVGHYLKVAPRAIFTAQMLGTVLGAIMNYIVNKVITTSQAEILLSPDGNNIWNGATPQTINSAAITWGAVGPYRMYGPDSQYYIVLWGFVIGFFVPIPGYLLHWKWPKVGFNYINTPLIMVGLCMFPGSTSSWLFFGFLLSVWSQFYLKRYKREWFVKHNYLLSAALDGATSVMGFLLAFIVFGGGNGNVYNFPLWWGNDYEGFTDRCCAYCE
ncbi:OPT family small oligopeptide transporter [Umbelopsis sp. AD052]|nr:OPT family small oligopeptide transporter [Umbelopsis sp. AD052]